ncbi:hypothetical protein [Agathobaculum sp. Marseille-P7918]|uniref:hypothetical protein n=1 Tax=Agathobaculum sp. Marseille-P7918 TaxID=2479843 RepID=UPI00356849C7
MINEEGINHLANDWYRDSNSGKVCIDSEKADAFLEAVRLGIEAMKTLSAEPTGDQPLSLEQMREMVNKPYWHIGLKEGSAPPHWSILDPLKSTNMGRLGWPTPILSSNSKEES